MRQSRLIFVGRYKTDSQKVQRTEIVVFFNVVTVRCTLEAEDCLLATNIEVLCTI